MPPADQSLTRAYAGLTVGLEGRTKLSMKARHTGQIKTHEGGRSQETASVSLLARFCCTTMPDELTQRQQER